MRLLAYSSLETIEVEINSAIGLCKRQFEKNKTASKAAEIGHQYWELCYLGIAEGSLLNHYLREAKSYLKISNGIESSGSNNLLLGRILLKQDAHEEAEHFFELALDAGILNYQVTPYLAECAFQNGDYQKVKNQVIQVFFHHLKIQILHLIIYLEQVFYFAQKMPKNDSTI